MLIRITENLTKIQVLLSRDRPYEKKRVHGMDSLRSSYLLFVIKPTQIDIQIQSSFLYSESSLTFFIKLV